VDFKYSIEEHKEAQKWGNRLLFGDPTKTQSARGLELGIVIVELMLETASRLDLSSEGKKQCAVLEEHYKFLCEELKTWYPDWQPGDPIRLGRRGSGSSSSVD